MTEEEKLHNIIRETVRETLQGIGFNVDAPQEVQADLLYLHNIRKGSEEISGLIKRSVITVCIPAFLYIAWEVLRQVMAR